MTIYRGVDSPRSPVHLVTGATGGIGLEIAQQLAARGDRVLVGARTESSGRAAAGTPVWMATSPALGSQTGQCFARRHAVTASELARDPATGRVVWDQTRQLLLEHGLASAADLSSIS